MNKPEVPAQGGILQDAFADAVDSMFTYGRRSQDLADALRLLMEPCRKLLQGHIEDGIPINAWDASEVRIAQVLESIDNLRREWRGDPIPANTSVFSRGPTQGLKLE
jgi:hypothetical protein